MGWPVDDTWEAIAASPHGITWLVTATRGTQTLSANMEVADATWTATWDGNQVTSEWKGSICDPLMDLFTQDPLCALAPWGQQLHVRAAMEAGRTWHAACPIGVFRIEETSVSDGGVWILQGTSGWRQPGFTDRFAPSGQQLDTTGRDMLQQLADEKWVTGKHPRNVDVRQAMEHIVDGTGIRLGVWADDTRIPADMDWGKDRLEAALTVAKAAGKTLWCDRVGALQLVDDKTGRARWEFSPSDDVGVSWLPSATRDGVSNGAAVQAETNGSRTEIWGAAYDVSSPLAWGGPFGRVPDISTSPTAHAAVTANREAEDRLRTSMKARTATVHITAPVNPAIDVMDTAVVTGGRVDMTGTITKISVSDHMELDVSMPWEQVWNA
nr:MAG TPA: protein of unknown function (DUF5047) [Caudoviricetes sp.]